VGGRDKKKKGEAKAGRTKERTQLGGGGGGPDRERGVALLGGGRAKGWSSGVIEEWELPANRKKKKKKNPTKKKKEKQIRPDPG